MSPRRTKPHIVGDQAVLQVQRSLPAAWITRIVTPDYGIDLEIEVPEESGKLKGLIAKAQIKGVSGASNDLRHIRISTEHLIYWQALPIRVYIFAAFVETNETFVLDVHRYVWARGFSDSLIKSNAKTHSIPLRDFVPFPQAEQYIRRELGEYADHLDETRRGGPYMSPAGRYVGAIFGAWMHGGEIDLNIAWMK